MLGERVEQLRSPGPAVLLHVPGSWVAQVPMSVKVPLAPLPAHWLLSEGGSRRGPKAVS